jgi:catechol 2,3-dioxygenase-like lactoylglutathione lyase family enzyme
VPGRSTRRSAGGAKRSRRPSSSRPAAWPWSCGAARSSPGTAAWRAGRRGGFGGIALAHNVRSRAEADELLAAAERAGAAVTKPAVTNALGFYSGVFLDPDGHAWEIAHNPGLPLAEDGSLTVPDFGSL